MLHAFALRIDVADLPIDSSDPISIEWGDKLLIPTDGIEEAMAESGEKFGTERMLNVVQKYRNFPARQIVENLYGSVQAFVAGSAQRDDITTILASFRSPEPN